MIRKEPFMKRSEINTIIKRAVNYIDKMNFLLPPFAFWSAESWKDKGSEYNEILENQLGWDITDFGSGDFFKIGLLMFTIRNGNFTSPKYKKPYAEKLLISEKGQVTPYHFHYKKMEDIINRGGGDLMVKLYNSKADESFDTSPVQISVDGRNYQEPAGTVVRVKPGESITLSSGCYHSFWAENGRILLGEVSTVNDDRTDNRFYEPVGRFPEIEEDEAPLYLLGMDFKNLK